MKRIILIFVVICINAYAVPVNWKHMYNSESIQTFEVDNNFVYIGKKNGLTVLDKSTLKKTIYNADNSPLQSSDIKKIIIDDDHRIWLATQKGLVEYHNGSFEIYKPSDDILLGDEINDVFISNDNKIYLATTQGVITYFNNRFNKIVHPKLNTNIESVVVIDSIMYYTLNYFMYFALNQINLNTMEYRSISTSMSSSYHISLGMNNMLRYIKNDKVYEIDGPATYYISSEYLQNEEIHFTKIINDSTQWFATDKKIIYNSGNEWKDFFSKDSLSFNGIVIDHNNNVFVTASNFTTNTKYNEIYRFDPENPKLVRLGVKTTETEYLSNKANKILKIDSNRILVAYDEGMTVFKDNKFENHHLSYSKLNNYYYSYVSPRNFVYAGDGKFIFTMDNDIYITDLYEYREIKRLSHNYLKDVARLSDGRVWLSDSQWGIYELKDSIFDPIQKDLGFDYEVTFAEIAPGKDNLVWLIEDDSPKVIKHNGIDYVEYDGSIIENMDFTDAAAAVWSDKFSLLIGTRDGDLIRFDGNTAQKYNKIYSNTDFVDINDIEIDESDNVWIASDNGLWYYDGVKFKRYSTGNTEIRYNKINDIEFDYDGKLWIATDLGVSIVNPDGLISNVEDFSEKQDFSIFPNPAKDHIVIRLPENKRFSSKDNNGIEIYDISGNKVLSVDTSYKQTLQRIEIAGLSNGVYFVKIGNQMAKFVKY